ncbi:MAG: L-2-amino-thiazoline-4-carboxylic acid hydrolase [Gammaproteobacteria bacterium]|nr:L-2-amino-thiazoline-4-carboxylic acid hydrolase [Gammaproteobacteria bacterium]
MDQSELTNLERMRIQMEYAVPLVRDLQRLLGEETVKEALASRVALLAEEQAQPGSKADFSRMEAGMELYARGGALDYDVIASDGDRFDVDITRCDYMRMMEDMDARDIGHLLICNLDYPIAARAGMDLTRSQTQMQGASFCDFRYRRRAP